MKPAFVIAAVGLLISASAGAAEVGVSVSVGQPGFFGRIDIGSFPRPPVIYAEPIVIAPAPVTVVRQPIYLRVPPGHARDWPRHCGRYAACGQPTYFVDDGWYQTVYAPRVIHVHGPVHAEPVVVHGARQKGKHGNKHGRGRHDR